jgi:hypothetical protein
MFLWREQTLAAPVSQARLFISIRSWCVAGDHEQMLEKAEIRASFFDNSG